jgi:hypothetical protein
MKIFLSVIKFFYYSFFFCDVDDFGRQRGDSVFEGLSRFSLSWVLEIGLKGVANELNVFLVAFDVGVVLSLMASQFQRISTVFSREFQQDLAVNSNRVKP